MRIRLLFKVLLVAVALIGFNALATRTQAQLEVASHAIDNITSRN